MHNDRETSNLPAPRGEGGKVWNRRNLAVRRRSSEGQESTLLGHSAFAPGRALPAPNRSSTVARGSMGLGAETGRFAAIIQPDNGEMSAIRHRRTETGRTQAPSWRNEVTLRSVEMFTEYEPGAYISFVSPTPLLMIVALGDHLTVADEALAAYERALAPKKLVTLAGGHFDAYVKDFKGASTPARDWFVAHLKK